MGMTPDSGRLVPILRSAQIILRFLLDEVLLTGPKRFVPHWAT